LLLAVDCFRKNRPEDAEIPLLGPDGVLDARMIRAADLKGNICVHPEADETFPRLKSQQRAVLQQLFSLNDPLIQEALAEPANIGYIKNVLGLAELVVPGEDSRNKQLREIQQLLANAPIVISMQPSGSAHVAAGFSPASAGREESDATEPSNATPEDAALKGGATRSASTNSHESQVASHQPQVLVLPSVPVDQLLDDHAVEFEECKRWANSEAGQAAKMTNPAGFANVRAHTEAHLRAMSLAVGTAAANSRTGPPKSPAKPGKSG